MLFNRIILLTSILTVFTFVSTSGEVVYFGAVRSFYMVFIRDLLESELKEAPITDFLGPSEWIAERHLIQDDNNFDRRHELTAGLIAFIFSRSDGVSFTLGDYYIRRRSLSAGSAISTLEAIYFKRDLVFLTIDAKLDVRLQIDRSSDSNADVFFIRAGSSKSLIRNEVNENFLEVEVTIQGMD